jgi:hypothetical protein
MTSKPFESWHVTDVLVGIPPAYLNMFVQRGLYGIKARVSGRRGDKNSRRFDEASVFGIALAWMLFESGLRTEPIRRVLIDIAETSEADAKAAAQVLGAAGLRYLVIVRELADQAGEAETELKVIGTDSTKELTDILIASPTASVLVVPVREKFDAIERRMALI